MYKNYIIFEINNAVLFINNVGFVMCCYKSTEYSVLMKTLHTFKQEKQIKKLILSIVETVRVFMYGLSHSLFFPSCEISE
jgi:hypothetical protein